jgi:flagellum-specific peptidoglycan hydrolase FlgJ
VHSVRKPWWQQATALVTVSTGGVITGFTFVPGAAATMTSPSNVPLHLMALEKAAKPAETGDGKLRPAIVNVAGYYLQLAQSRTPAQMEALIWGKDSLDGADHGPSCAAFASLTLELAAQAVGQQSWVSGGATYPWPLHEWADVRVNPNPDSLGVTSIVQDAQAHQRWHPIGDGYQPQPGDWVVFDGHVEVVTGYANGSLDTIGADSLPNLTVNAHSFPDPLAQQGVEGFVDNGHLAETTAASSTAPAAAPAPASGAGTARGTRSSAPPQTAVIPGVVAPAVGAGQPGTSASGEPDGAAAGGTAPGSPAQSTAGSATPQAKADIPGAAVAAGLAVAAPRPSSTGTAAPGRTSAPYRQHAAPAAAAPGTKTQQAFINQIAPGALSAQQRYGVPASVTIAQAIDESGWGTSQLATSDYNLFGIKGSGPAGSVTLPTQEFENGQWVTIYAQFRVYHNVSESIADHAELLATSGYYTRAMADRAVPDAFANDLTGVYATDPEYGANLIGLMRLYNLYRFDSPAAGQAQAAAPSGAASHRPASHSPAGSAVAGAQPSIPGILSVLSPGLGATPVPAGSNTPATQPSGAHPSASQPSGSQASVPGILSALAPAPSGTPAPRSSHTPTAQPSASQAPPAQPTAAATSGAPPSGVQPSVGQASVPGMMSALSPTVAATPAPSATQTPAATAPPAATPGTSRAAGGPGGGAIPANGAASQAASAAQGNAATRAPAAAPRANGAASVQGAAAVPGVTSATSTSSATQRNSAAAHRNYAAAGPGAAAVPGTGISGPASSPAQGNTGTYESTASYGNPAPPSGSSPAAGPGGAAVPGVGAAVSGLGVAGAGAAVRRGRTQRRTTAAPAQPARRRGTASQTRGPARAPGLAAPAAIRYETPLPAIVATAFFAKAKGPLARAEQLHRDVAGRAGIRWQLLAACDWMQCHADHTLSPVNGERLGKHNPDGTVYQTKSQALAQCASDLIYLAGAVYGLDLTARRALPVRALADVFAAFRWGGLLMRNGVSAMEFPYSVAGLTEQHLKMHWPVIGEPEAPDKPGSKFRGQFGAVPVLLSLNYPALV